MKRKKKMKKDWSPIVTTVGVAPRPVGRGVSGRRGPRRDRCPIGRLDRARMGFSSEVHAKQPADMYICRHTATCDRKGKGGKDCPHSRQHLHYDMCDAGCGFHTKPTCAPARDLLVKPEAPPAAEKYRKDGICRDEDMSVKPPSDHRRLDLDVICLSAALGECYGHGCGHHLPHKREDDCKSPLCKGLGCVPEHIADERKKWAECRMAGSDKVARKVAAHEGSKPAAENCRIRFRLEKWERALMFQVLHMDERFRAGKYPDEKNFTVPFSGIPTITVVSMYQPRLLGDGDNITHIHLRGSENKMDFQPDCMFFSDNSARDRAYTLILNVLGEWAHNWEGFREVRPKMADCGTGVFEF